MGANQSTASNTTNDEFKNYVYGTTLLMLAPQLDPEFRFEECSAIKDEDKHVLPLVSNNSNLTVDEMLEQYTQYYGSNNGKEEAIDRYVREHILDSKEHIMGFIKSLVSHLQDRRARAQEKVARLRDDQSYRTLSSQRRPPVQEAATVQAMPAGPPVSTTQMAGSETEEGQLRRVRGHGRLQRKMAAINQAIDSEQVAYQLQQGPPSAPPPTPLPTPLPTPKIAQAYMPAYHGEEGIEEIYANEEGDTQEGEFEQRTYSGDALAPSANVSNTV